MRVQCVCFYDLCVSFVRYLCLLFDAFSVCFCWYVSICVRMFFRGATGAVAVIVLLYSSAWLRILYHRPFPSLRVSVHLSVSAWTWIHLTLLSSLALSVSIAVDLSFLCVYLSSSLFPSLSVPPLPPPLYPSLLSTGILAYPALSNQTMDALTAVGGEGKPRTAYGRLAAGKGSRCPSFRGWGPGDESV